MKKLLTITAIAIGITLFSNVNSYAQNQFKAGAGISYGTEVEAIGIQVGATYDFTKEISGAADFVIYFPEHYDWFEININGHYKFYEEDNISVYGLAGLNYVSVSIDIPRVGEYGGGSVSSSDIGLNIGGGAEFGAGPGDIYAELKYALSSSDQLGISAGYRYSF